MKKNSKNQEEFVITRVFDASREKVWKAWTDPDIIRKWWGPKDFTAPSATVGLRVGGKYLYSMRGAVTPRGEKKDYWSGGTFRKIIPMEKLVITDSFADEKGNVVSAKYYGMDENWPMEMQIEIAFEEQNIPPKEIDCAIKKTRLTLKYLNMSGIDSKDLKNMRQGWNQSLDKLAESLK
jgi:uncharacterized protein YndB with AHSA1/START domain